MRHTAAILALLLSCGGKPPPGPGSADGPACQASEAPLAISLRVAKVSITLP